MPVLHRMGLRQLTTRQSIPDVQITPQEWKPDPDVSIIYDDLQARAWKREYERPFFNNDQDNAATPNSSRNVVRSDLPTCETSNTRGSSRERSPETFSQTK